MQFYGNRYRTLGLAADDLASSSRQDVSVVIIPPDVDYQTDNEEIDEDDLQSQNIPNDVPGEIELEYANDESDSDDEYNIPLSIIRQNLLRVQNATSCEKPDWTEDLLDISMVSTTGYMDRLDNLKVQIEGKTPVEIFETVFDSKVIDLIMEQTNLYALQNNNHLFCVTQEEIKIFIAILLLSGYHRLPRERNYWCLDEDLLVPPVANAMSRNRFQEIKKYLHLADNTQIDKNDKMYKVRPLMNKLNKNFQQFGIFHKDLSIDEAMIKYFGHHSSKQFIRGKPVRFGYKDWMLCSSTGYCYNFDTYCGAAVDKTALPLGSRVVLQMLEIVDVPTDHEIFFDNYFTSYNLMQTLKEKGFQATGTARENRIKKCPLLSSSEMKKKGSRIF